MIKQFKKKPIIIEAIQYNGNNENEIIEFTEGMVKHEKSIGGSADGNGYPQLYSRLSIMTNEGEMLVSENDYVIKEPFPINDRKYYPCKLSIFNQTYDEV